jgi:hypothetical protein
MQSSLACADPVKWDLVIIVIWLWAVLQLSYNPLGIIIMEDNGGR